MLLPQHAIPLPPALRALLDDPACHKLLAALDADGAPAALLCPSLTAAGDRATLLLGSALERGQDTQLLLRALWFDRPVTLHLSRGETAFAVAARVYRCHIAGSPFSALLARARALEGPDAPLAAAWELIPTRCDDQSPGPLLAEARQLRPYHDRQLGG